MTETKGQTMSKNITQKIIEVTRLLEQYQRTMKLDQALKLENTLRQLKRQRDLEAKRAYQEFIMGVCNDRN